MDAVGDFAEVPAFDLTVPERQTSPFVFNSPHSGRCYPQRFMEMSRLDATAIRRSEDCYVDQLFAGTAALGAPFLKANFPRAYVDVNREPWELDPRMFADPLPSFANIRSPRVAGGLGTVPRLVGEGLEIYQRRLPLTEAAMRIRTIYEPYHACLGDLVRNTRDTFGHAVLVDCHSMPASIRVADGGARPDFIIGDRFGTSAMAALSEQAIALLSGMGYRVAHNKPYAGGFITEHYGRPAIGVHALQIEVNRGLYMNEVTLAKTDGFSRLGDDITIFARDFIALCEMMLAPQRLAAE